MVAPRTGGASLCQTGSVVDSDNFIDHLLFGETPGQLLVIEVSRSVGLSDLLRVPVRAHR